MTREHFKLYLSELLHVEEDFSDIDVYRDYYRLFPQDTISCRSATNALEIFDMLMKHNIPFRVRPLFSDDFPEFIFYIGNGSISVEGHPDTGYYPSDYDYSGAPKIGYNRNTCIWENIVRLPIPDKEFMRIIEHLQNLPK